MNDATTAEYSSQFEGPLDFDEQSYLDANPDVRLAVDEGRIASGFAHWKRHGHKEGRRLRREALQSAIDSLAQPVAVTRRSHAEFAPSDEPQTNAEKVENIGDGLLQPHVVYVSGLSQNTSHIYRVEHQVDALNAAGISAVWVPVEEVDRYQHKIIFSQVVVFFRVAWSSDLASIVEKCRKAGVRVMFDVDDYVFDLAIANARNVDGLRFLKPDDLPQYFDGVRRYREMADNADAGIVTTEFLARGMRDLGKTCHVIRNGFNAKTLEASEAASAAARETKETTQQIRLGYASGSMTHQKDFAVAASAVARVMAEHPDVVLVLSGLIALDEFPELLRFSDRIERRPLVSHDRLPWELARFDINLAPLELGNPFCEGKSELKYYEAALVHVPTIATATSTFCSAITDGVTGFLARTSDDWYGALKRLVSDSTLRGQFAAAARRHVLTDYGPEAKKRQVEALFRPLIESCLRQRRVSPDAYSQTVTFVVPGMLRGSGGHNKILSIARWFARLDYTVMLTFTEATSEYPSVESITEEFGLDERFIRVVYSDCLVAHSNITFATYWKTVYNIERSDCWAGRRYHFLQDYEPYFFPMSTDYLLAINAMRKDFTKISYGPWIKKIIAERHNLTAAEVPFYIDKTIYRVESGSPRREDKVLYFARPEMPRRCFDLGIEALKLFQERYGDEAEIALFGSYTVEHIALPIKFTDLRVLAPLELARRYNEATVGLVFSPTNPSMVPFEMMACGLPVIDLDVEGNAENYGGCENAFFANPDPHRIAEVIHTVLRDKQARDRVAHNGQAFAAAMCEEQAIKQLMQIIDPSHGN